MSASTLDSPSRLDGGIERAAQPPEAAPSAGVSEDLGLGRLVLPGGVLDEDGRCHKVVRVRELDGTDEERLCDRSYANGAEQVTDLLSHLLLEVEGLERPVDRDLVADLLVGDRDYLILRLRQLTLGDAVLQTLRCPALSCGEKVDVEFEVSGFPVRRLEAPAASYPFQLSRPAFEDDPTSDRGRLRLPTGRDQAAVAELLGRNRARGHSRLFSRVVLEIGRSRGLEEERARALPLKVRQELALQLEELAPGPEVAIQ